MSYSMAGTVSYTFRIPADLKRLLEERAALHSQSLASIIIGACWARLDCPTPDTPQRASKSPDRQSLAALLATGAVSLGMPSAEPIETEPEQPPCPYREFEPESGEWYGCALRAHGPKVKHQRGAKL